MRFKTSGNMFQNDKKLYILKNLCPSCNESDINQSNILRHGALVSHLSLSIKPTLRGRLYPVSEQVGSQSDIKLYLYF